MPWSGGQFTRIHDWVDDKNAGIAITASRMDQDSDDFTSGINNCIAKDGSNTPTSPLNMGGLRLTNVGNATALTDAPNLNQVQAGVANFGAFGGTSDALTLTLSPAQTTIADGTEVWGRFGSSNTTTAPTFAFNATTARTIVMRGGLPVPVNAWRANQIGCLKYDSANTRWEFTTPAIAPYIIAKGGGITAPTDTSENTLFAVSLPPMTANDVVRVTLNFQVTNNANAKTVRGRFSGGAGTSLSINLASAVAWTATYVLANQNATNSQVAALTYLNSGVGAGSAGTANSAVDTTAATSYVFTIQKGTGADSVVLISYTAELLANGT